MLEEATGLSADYREVRRLRRLLAAARAEATTALAEAQSPGRGAGGQPPPPMPPTPPGAAARQPSSPPPSPGADRDGAESGCMQCQRLKLQLEALQARVTENESTAAAEFEEVRRESNGFVQLLASHLRNNGMALDNALQRLAALERAVAAQQLPGPSPERSSSPGRMMVLSEELGRQREAVRQLQEELNSVKKGLLTLHAAMWRSQQHERAQHAQQQQQAAPVSEASHSHAPAPSYNVPTPAQQSSMQHHNAHHQPMQPVSREP
ncbi:g7544 [Coccomyxa viridis]|uniref:G7544 protein n=1 Tax=Coccomyxa viridis TaxID=1274662 RepID=A0ABP1FY40_9CHLO